MNMELKYPLCNIQTDQAGTLEFSISMCKETLVSRCGLSLEDIEHFLQDLQNEISNFKSVMEILQKTNQSEASP